MVAIREAEIKDVPIIQQLANAIWPDAYGTILKSEQIQYMLNLYYNSNALEQQIRNGQSFLLIEENELPLGFTSFGRLSIDSWKLHKLYVLTNRRGAGFGKKLLDDVIDKVKQANASKLFLNVNRYNPALDFYLRQGFTIQYEEDIDIGEGYFMNDYVMKKNL